MSERRPIVAIFDDARTNRFRLISAKGAEAAGWLASEFTVVRDAIEEVKYGADALITSLGTARSYQRAIAGDFPAIPLIKAARLKSAPIALVDGRPDARDFLPPDERSIVIPKLRSEELTARVTNWLLQLSITTR